MLGTSATIQQGAVTVAENKANLQTALDTLAEAFRCKNEALAAYFFKKFKNGEDVPWRVLSSMPDNQMLDLPTVKGGVIKTIKHAIGNALIYNTNWTGGATLTMHHHSDCAEKLEILEGRALVIVKVTGGKRKYELGPGEVLDIGAGLPHQTTALIPTKMRIEFTK